MKSLEEPIDDDQIILSPTTNDDGMRQRKLLPDSSFSGNSEVNAENAHPVVVERASNKIDTTKNYQNYLFGFKPWKGMLGERKFEERSDKVKQLHMWNDRSLSSFEKKSFLSIGNVLYVIFIGWWMFLTYLMVGVLSCLAIFTIPYGLKCFKFSFYYLYPFGKYVERVKVVKTSRRTESSPLLNAEQVPIAENVDYYNDDSKLKWYQRYTVLDVISYLIWLLIAPILLFSHLMVSLMSWFSIVGIPTSKIHFEGIKFLYRHFLSLNVSNEYPPKVTSDVILCTIQATNIYYYKHNVFGLNVILFNMLPFSLVSIVLGYAFGEEFVTKYSVLIFPFCLISTVPLSYLIGKAIAAISAQTNFLIGALLNSICGSIIEMILYILALSKNLHDVVVSAITGALLLTILLVPGLAMVLGGLKFKQQFFNKQAASVSSALLLVSVVAALLPSLFYQLYSGHYELKCGVCVNAAINVNETQGLKLPIVGNINGSNVNTTQGYGLVCDSCVYVQKDMLTDPVYTRQALPLAYTVSAILPIAYLIGLIFSLKTHRYLIERPPVPENKEDHVNHQEEEEIGAVWPIWLCVGILVLCTIVYSLVAEVMTASLEPAFDMIGVNPMFAGLTFLSIVPSCAEFVNAIQFALQNNISLALEIGNSASIQIALIQMPVLVLVSALLFSGDELRIFNLMFPQINLIAIFFGVLVLNFVCLDGKTNYFQGSALVIVYILIVVTFFFAYF
ncbi:predicted protein [Naegleria gruberi]|uniref:Predicted protein n=1 Tax=Naegleria gruberi TaxID=5762 RepID=D2VEL2_NAEGR|nr:uncharacterized protein NAEGRDRAFT_67316 [Naegleria gruberi]EFC44904.1 predicted protein [Naegleria gruberi]|eukprot:XP_002677648.1 predicted protein [Naegleria gruberi strain NEG-M]